MLKKCYKVIVVAGLIIWFGILLVYTTPKIGLLCLRGKLLGKGWQPW